jgi:hypothetical protein
LLSTVISTANHSHELIQAIAPERYKPPELHSQQNKEITSVNGNVTLHNGEERQRALDKSNLISVRQAWAECDLLPRSCGFRTVYFFDKYLNEKKDLFIVLKDRNERMEGLKNRREGRCKWSATPEHVIIDNTLPNAAERTVGINVWSQDMHCVDDKVS